MYMFKYKKYSGNISYISLNRDNNRMYYEGVIATEEALPIFVNCKELGAIRLIRNYIV